MDTYVSFQNFETSGRDLAVDHFSLFSNLGNPSLATDRRPAYEGIPVPLISTFDTDRWNVYYYETADMKHCLTLFVEPENDRHRTIGLKRLHIKRGKITDFT
ncbi:hypothetical protein AAVH_25707 [Aphelenchoides avenae]|nr:hypothetical protein AAVH_25707 [Aphelenchus avenae]